MEYWKCANGESIAVSKMTTQHIECVMLKLENNDTEWANEWYDIFYEELKRRKNES